MQDATLPILNEWHSFYDIIGSASAALTGLVFVVITLVSGMRQRNPSPDGISTFSTPTVIYFCMALFMSVLFSAPWHAFWQPCLLLGIASVGGLVYDSIVFRRATRQTSYTPVLEDWIWHIILPFVAFTTLLIASFATPFFPTTTLFFIGAVSILFLFIGIHNSWDTVTYLTIEYVQQKSNVQNEQDTSSNQSEQSELSKKKG